MAWSIADAGNKVIRLLKNKDIAIDSAIEEQLRTQRNIQLFGYHCMVANVMSLSSFRVRVNPAWYRPNGSDTSKPSFKSTSMRDGFDFQLIPTDTYLYALYYLELRDYSLLLENDRNRWFKEPWWGIKVNENDGTFVWEGGNTRQFPLTPICSHQALALRKKQYQMAYER